MIQNYIMRPAIHNSNYSRQSTAIIYYIPLIAWLFNRKHYATGIEKEHYAISFLS